MIPFLITVGAFALGYTVGKTKDTPEAGPKVGIELDEDIEALGESIEEVKQDLIKSEMSTMLWEIEQSEKSKSYLINKKDSYEVSHRIYENSTFPKWFGELGFNSKDDFKKCYLKGLKTNKGIRFTRIKNEAIERLTNGYKNEHGQELPNEFFGEVPF